MPFKVFSHCDKMEIFMRTDTIAAISTAMTNSGIGIIRISGDEAISIANKIVVFKNNHKKLIDMKSHTIHYGFIYDGNDFIDEVMVSVMKAPYSYTTEDTVEINCHGGIMVMNTILEVVIKNGARMAEPGEFTKRAFLNGRIDLTKAEAVMDVINSKNKYAMKSSAKQLKGDVYKIIKNLRDDIIYEIAFIESSLDDPEHISLEGYPEKLSSKTDSLLLQIDKLLKKYDNGKIIKEGINTVIVGKPNVGKSSLLNLLAGEEKAIVTDIAGTTRDVLEESVRMNDILLNIIDTAGIRDTEDVVEKIGVNKAKKYAEDADLIIFVVDSSVPLEQSDKEIIQLIKDKKVIVLLNKSDLDTVVNEEVIKDLWNDDNNISIIKTSTKENLGMDILEENIKNMFFSGDISFNDEIFITSLRHKEALTDAYNSLTMVKRSLEDDMPEDFYSIDLMSAYTSLGFIIGEEVGEDLVNEIFSKFCMGK